MKYISIDGDDVGRKITSLYLSNNEKGLSQLSQLLKDSTKEIAELLDGNEFKVIFCAADGVVASIDKDVDISKIFDEIQKLAPQGITFSAGLGASLRESYMALTFAKCNGKNCLHDYSVLSAGEGGVECV
ncbi:mCpol domain-containing protein [Pseudoalteromonas sp. MT33b]|uniref:mCpol domain-containing protein n=1 Tax=Pseudoalteromonas sp. MT33b TaxID=2759705 RepID=UPI0015FB9673|nr:mCpol domain-containing protein [Pseudoalteromonas sp. MT33b]QMW13690.1 mCpol domain-containing protein [Pseudoalteromonas sp. MT33b]